MKGITRRNEFRKERVTLDEWQEIIGKFIALKERDNLEVTLSIQDENKKLIYPKDSKEADILKEKLKDIEKGFRIGILRTDLDERPICIREEG